jgi:hypothetical protein
LTDPGLVKRHHQIHHASEFPLGVRRGGASSHWSRGALSLRGASCHFRTRPLPPSPHRHIAAPRGHAPEGHYSPQSPPNATS